MASRKIRSDSPLKRRARRGFRGYPVATIAFYGPNDERASKVAVAILTEEGADPKTLERWFSEDRDVRSDPTVGREILDLLRVQGVKSASSAARINGEPIIRKGPYARSAHSGRIAIGGPVRLFTKLGD